MLDMRKSGKSHLLVKKVKGGTSTQVDVLQVALDTTQCEIKIPISV